LFEDYHFIGMSVNLTLTRNLINRSLSEDLILKLWWFTVIGSCLFPIFLKFPYRVNIFLSYEGAYRLLLGQIPYKDFGIPMGFVYWIPLAIFFKIFGTKMISLVYCQVFINFLTLFWFRGILKNLAVNGYIIFLSTVVFILSYTLLNFWPWYNNMVFVWGLGGLFFILSYKLESRKRLEWLKILASGFFMSLAFFTKQDSGAISFLIGFMTLFVLIYEQRKYSILLIYLFSFLLFSLLFIIPFLQFIR
jgi:hypothetical protein